MCIHRVLTFPSSVIACRMQTACTYKQIRIAKSCIRERFRSAMLLTNVVSHGREDKYLLVGLDRN